MDNQRNRYRWFHGVSSPCIFVRVEPNGTVWDHVENVKLNITLQELVDGANWFEYNSEPEMFAGQRIVRN